MGCFATLQHDRYVFHIVLLTSLAFRDPRGTTSAVLHVTYRCK